MFRELVFTSFVIFCWTDVLASPIPTIEAAKLASIMKLNLDTTVNPCDNAHRFVCGSSNVTSLKEKNNSYETSATQLVMDLIQKGTGSKDFRPFQLIDDVHKTCMSDEATGEQVVKSLPHIFELLGDWPLLHGSRWQTRDYMWIDFILHSKVVGTSVNPFLTIEPVVDPETDGVATKFAVTSAPPEFKRRITDASDPLLVAYTTYLEKACELMDCEKTYPDEIKDIVDFEWKLSEIRLRGCKSYTLKELTFKELTEKYPSVFWFKLRYILDPINGEKLDITNMTFFVTPILSDVIDLLDKTDPRVLSNYASWKVLQAAIPYLTKDFQDLKQDYCKTQKCEDIPREFFCYKVVLNYLKPAVNLLYAKRYFTQEADSLVSDMVANIKRQTKDLISKSRWMNQDEKKKRIDDVDKMPVIIGYEEKNCTDDEFVKYFEELEIDPSNFFQTLLNLEKFDYQRRFYGTEGLGQRNFINPVLAYRPENVNGKLYVPLGMFREPFFSVDYPMSVNYGITGKLIAKELVVGIFYLPELASQDIKDKVAYFKKQVARSCLQGTNKEPHLTALLISHHRGLKISHQAYLSWLASLSGGSEPMIPELPYSNRQLFWMSSLQNICVQPTNNTIIYEDKYTPVEFRIMKILNNVPEFYDDFSCQSKSFLETYGPSCSIF